MRDPWLRRQLDRAASDEAKQAFQDWQADQRRENSRPSMVQLLDLQNRLKAPLPWPFPLDERDRSFLKTLRISAE
jgi:hypothetical protein